MLIQVVNFSALLYCHLCVYLQEFFSLNDLFLHFFLVYLINLKIVVQVVIIIPYWIAHLNTLLYFLITFYLLQSIDGNDKPDLL